MTVIFFVSGIIFFLGLDWLVQRARRKAVTETAPIPRGAAATACPLRTPEGIFFAKSHTWLSLFPSGRIRLGLDDLVAGLMENPQITFLKRVGECVIKGEPLMTIGEGERRLTVCAPLSGEILGVNSALSEAPRRMREKLFSEGWAYTIRPQSLQELREMLIGGESRTWMLNEFSRLRAFLTASAPGVLATATVQDGGTPTTGVLKSLDSAKWLQFEEQFLRVR
jgi:glycine cleavage system H protein